MLKAFYLAAACCLSVAPALAQVDQSNPFQQQGQASVSVSVDQYHPLFQTFTPTLSGIDYASFMFFSFASTTIVNGKSVNGPSVPASFTVSLLSGEGPNGNVLGTTLPTLVPANQSQTNFTFNFANRQALTPGQAYTLVINDLTYVPGSFYDDDAIYTTSDTYAGGYAAPSRNADLVFSEGINDGPAAVPEPASWALMIGGFGMVGTALRRTRRWAANIA